MLRNTEVTVLSNKLRFSVGGRCRQLAIYFGRETVPTVIRPPAHLANQGMGSQDCEEKKQKAYSS